VKRLSIEARPNWQATVEKVGMTYHTLEVEEGVDPTYWDETHAYEFTSEEVDRIEEASQILYRMALSAVDYVFTTNQLGRLSIPPEFHPLVKKSWERQDIDLYGRFDLALAPDGTPKMLEFNADTPTSLLEAAVVQWYWMEDYARRTGQTLDQFNSIHETLMETMKDIGQQFLGPNETFYFAAMESSMEDVQTTEYLRDVAIQAGMPTQFIGIENIGWNGTVFVDMDEKPIRTIFKLYPWEWLIREDFGRYMIKQPWDMIEPAWKLILSNKGILPIMWELYPDHPNLLASYWDSSKLGQTYVEKPLLSREGADVKIYRDGKLANTVLERGYGVEGEIYQEYMPLPKFDGMTPIIGSWIVGGKPCGVGIREDSNEVTGNTSRFVPHYFK
jgi:glutathionylspermidine synthase